MPKSMPERQFVAIKRSKDGKPVRYLIVDDSVFARKNLARMIETFGGQVAGEAEDGVTAISEYQRLKPDIVLMDITMPQMDGIEATEKIVQQYPEACIVVVSSRGYPENIEAAMQCGARHFVQKPVKPEVLYEVIKYAMGADDRTATSASASLGVLSTKERQARDNKAARISREWEACKAAQIQLNLSAALGGAHFLAKHLREMEKRKAEPAEPVVKDTCSHTITYPNIYGI